MFVQRAEISLLSNVVKAVCLVECFGAWLGWAIALVGCHCNHDL
jgi:hypothetical protein